MFITLNLNFAKIFENLQKMGLPTTCKSLGTCPVCHVIGAALSPALPLLEAKRFTSSRVQAYESRVHIERMK